ncbi:Exocyst subunit Exo70 family protein [Quillaja saponaria]|uniref:Exocyst subunit Exo70 family protein n=1 Tax=Quillaja saponaria TaxID=32244 RepID=A0AAD7PIZ7_QUISA|nr:Exocyst subunit Exo70 family protein [Quillaja saponaria]
MGDSKSVIPTCEGEQHVIAAAQHILMALGECKILSDDLKKNLLDLGIQLSAMSRVTEGDGGQFKEVEKQLKSATDKVMSWDSNQSMIRDSGSMEGCDYLKTVDEIQIVIGSLKSLSVDDNWKQKELLQRADCILQIAMLRLEKELLHILFQHKQYFEPEYMSFHSTRVDILYDESFTSVEDDSDEIAEEASRRNNGGDEIEEHIIDLVHPGIIPDLMCIANVMYASKYHHEFCQAFITSRRDALDEYFVILEMKIFTIEDVLQMEWSCLNFEMKKWIRAMKIIVRVYLASEKRLCEQILGNLGSDHQFCFHEISKSSMLRLLNFGEAIAMGTHKPEKLFRLLDMYEVLADILVDVDVLFLEEAISFIRTEFHKLLSKFGNSIRRTFQAFGNAIATDPSLQQFPRGGIHHLTKYVMNHIKALAEYGDLLNLLLEDLSPVIPSENDQDISPLTFCPTAHHLQSLASSLESTLTNKSKLYTDVALQHIFMMNNIHYMVQKVKGSDLRLFFGDFWIRQHIGKFQQHATSYERATWSSVLSLLREAGWANSASKPSLKERCRGFSIAFEEVYKTQTGWCIPDAELRDEIQISASQKVIHAYRTFLGQNSNISEKYIKYTVDDLENYILDLLQGSPRSLHYHQRRK